VTDLDALAANAVARPVAPPPSLGHLREMAGRRRRRRAWRAGIATVGAVAIGGLAAAIVAADHSQRSSLTVGANPAPAELRDPGVGRVLAERLPDGSPIWVVHHRDGTVTAVSAVSTHVPFGIRQLVGWCATNRTFEDGMNGSQWDEFGHRLGGPAPTGLPSAPGRSIASGHLQVGPLEVTPAGPAGEHSTPVVDLPPTPACFAGDGVGYDAGTTELHTFAASAAAGVNEVAHQVTRRPSTRYRYVTGAALVVFPTDAVLLCPRARAPSETSCSTGVPVTGIDGAGLRARQEPPSAHVLVEGSLLLPPGRGSVTDVTFVHGYRIEPFTPAHGSVPTDHAILELPRTVSRWLRAHSSFPGIGRGTSADWVLTTHGAASRITSGGGPDPDAPVYLVDVHGTFVWDHSCPAGAPPSACVSRGKDLVFTLDPQRLQVLDSGVESHRPDLAQFGPVGHVTF